jgi:hypothetical protein
MPVGAFVGAVPPIVFLLFHLAAFGAAGAFAFKAFGAERASLGWGFTLFALAELIYVTYHLDLTVLLFAHAFAELLAVGAIVLLFAGALRSGRDRPGREEEGAQEAGDGG